MGRSCKQLLTAALFILSCVIVSSPSNSFAQTVHVDVSAGKAIMFDPDKAMGTSMDILSSKDLNAVYSEPIVKAGLSAGGGPSLIGRTPSSPMPPGTGTQMGNGVMKSIRTAISWAALNRRICCVSLLDIGCRTGERLTETRGEVTTRE